MEAMLATADALQQQGDLPGAVAAYRQALEAAPDDVTVMDGLAELLLEAGEGGAAADILQRSIELAPDQNAAKYMYLGQMREGAEAIACFERGIAVMRQEATQLEQATEAAVAGGPTAESTRQEVEVEQRKLMFGLCAAHCAIAEVLLLDTAECGYAREHLDFTANFCLDAALQTRAEAELSRAQEYDKESPEPYQGLASLRIAQGRADEAKAALETAVQHTRTRVEAARSADTLFGSQSGAHSHLAHLEVPSFGFRMSGAKLLLELGEWAEAVAALELLMQEHDEDVELWYLLGLAHGLHGDRPTSSECMTHALQLLDKFGEEADTSGQLRGQVMAAIDELETLESIHGDGNTEEAEEVEFDDAEMEVGV